MFRRLGNEIDVTIFVAGRVSYDQLLFNPPDGKPSKGTRLSGAIWVTCPFFMPLSQGFLAR